MKLLTYLLWKNVPQVLLLQVCNVGAHELHDTPTRLLLTSHEHNNVAQIMGVI